MWQGQLNVAVPLLPTPPSLFHRHLHVTVTNVICFHIQTSQSPPPFFFTCTYTSLWQTELVFIYKCQRDKCYYQLCLTQTCHWKMQFMIQTDHTFKISVSPAKTNFTHKSQILCHNNCRYHWQEPPQVFFFSRQKFVVTSLLLSQQTHVCSNKTRHLSQQKYACTTTFLLRWTQTQVFVAKKKLCQDKNILSRQAIFLGGGNKGHVRVCHNKTFVAPKMILVAAPASEMQVGTVTTHHVESSRRIQTNVCMSEVGPRQVDSTVQGKLKIKKMQIATTCLGSKYSSVCYFS